MMKSDPYQAVRSLCASLEAEGHNADTIIDALLCSGLNAGAKQAGPEFVVSYLHKMIAVFEAAAGRRPQPPTLMQ